MNISPFAYEVLKPEDHGYDYPYGIRKNLSNTLCEIYGFSAEHLPPTLFITQDLNKTKDLKVSTMEKFCSTHNDKLLIVSFVEDYDKFAELDEDIATKLRPELELRSMFIIESNFLPFGAELGEPVNESMFVYPNKLGLQFLHSFSLNDIYSGSYRKPKKLDAAYACNFVPLVAKRNDLNLLGLVRTMLEDDKNIVISLVFPEGVYIVTGLEADHTEENKFYLFVRGADGSHFRSVGDDGFLDFSLEGLVLMPYLEARVNAKILGSEISVTDYLKEKSVIESSQRLSMYSLSQLKLPPLGKNIYEDLVTYSTQSLFNFNLKEYVTLDPLLLIKVYMLGVSYAFFDPEVKSFYHLELRNTESSYLGEFSINNGRDRRTIFLPPEAFVVDDLGDVQIYLFGKLYTLYVNTQWSRPDISVIDSLAAEGKKLAERYKPYEIDKSIENFKSKKHTKADKEVDYPPLIDFLIDPRNSIAKTVSLNLFDNNNNNNNSSNKK